MKNKLFILIALIVMLVLSAQCTPAPAATEAAPAEPPAEPTAAPAKPTAAPAKLRIAMVLPGPITDKGWNTGGKYGLDYLGTTYGAETAYQDAVPTTDYVEVYRDFASHGFNIIIGHGNEFNDPAVTVSKEYPDLYFVVLGGQTTPGGNLMSVVAHEAQSTFIPGYIAGKMTKTNKIAGIGGFDFPGIIAQLEGFRQGAEYGNPDVEVSITYIGTFEDTAKAKEAALAQIDAGADVVFHIVDNAGVGVFEAVKQKDVYGVGFAMDQSQFAPDNVITSQLQDFGKVYGAAVKIILSGEPIKTEQYRFGYETDPSPIGHADTNLIPKELHEEAVALEKKLASGEIKTELIFTK